MQLRVLLIEALVVSVAQKVEKHLFRTRLCTRVGVCFCCTLTEPASFPAWIVYCEHILLQYKYSLEQTLGKVHTLHALTCNLKIIRVSTQVHIQLLSDIIVPETSATK